MSQIIQKLDQQQLKSLCGIVAHTSEGLTKSELTTLLGQCGICAVNDGSSRNQLGYTIGLNKRDWLYNCLVAEINKSQSFSRVFSFLQAALNPASYTSVDSRQKYRYLLEETNKILLFAGLSIDQSGRLVAVSQAETLTEVDQRVNHLKKALYDRAIHSKVQKYCIEDYLRADYYDAVFEAAKGLAERVRQISGLTTDGGTLFQTALSKNDPYICNKSISYELSFFVGNIIDIIEISGKDLVNPLPNLHLLQRRLKYGVKTEIAASICEKIFNDRFLANLLADEIGHDAIGTDGIVGVIQSHKDNILDILSTYPTYFSMRVKLMCND